MLAFMKKYSYDAVRMLLNQCAISIFGLVLTIACQLAGNGTLRLICSVLAIVFYLFLIYTMTWEMGSKDGISADFGHAERQPLKGFFISLMANALNFLMALGVALGTLVADGGFFSNLGGFCGSAALLLQGMYTGVLAEHVGGAALNSYWFSYFLTPLPAMLTALLAYILGMKNVKFTKLFDVQYPESDREPKKKKDKKK